MRKAIRIREYLALAIILVALVLLFGALSGRFLSATTFGAIANCIPTLALAATGMTLVLIVGGIDLSIGSVLPLAGAVLGVALVDWHRPFAACAALAGAVGLAAGLANGALIVGLTVTPFIVTLGMMEMARGAAYIVTISQPKYLGTAVEGLARPLDGTGLSGSFLLALVVVVFAQLLLSRSVIGRWMFPTGSNETVTRYSGIDPRPVKLSTYALAGASDPNAGTGLELSAIAAAVINAFFGILIIITTLEAGLAQVRASEPVKRLVTGGVIVLAVLADAWRQRAAGNPFPLSKRLSGRTTRSDPKP